MSVSYQVEDWFKVRPELLRLLPLHWREVAGEQDKIPLEPDWALYNDLANHGILHVVTARVDRTELIGYHISFVRPHPHYKTTLMAFTDVYFIEKPYRKGRVGINLFREFEDSVRQRGVRKLFTGTKLALDVGAIFEHLGWTESERTFTKYVGD